MKKIIIFGVLLIVSNVGAMDDPLKQSGTVTQSNTMICGTNSTESKTEKDKMSKFMEVAGSDGSKNIVTFFSAGATAIDGISRVVASRHEVIKSENDLKSAKIKAETDVEVSDDRVIENIGIMQYKHNEFLVSNTKVIQENEDFLKRNNFKDPAEEMKKLREEKRKAKEQK